MYIEIILLVGFSMVITLLMNMVPKETEMLGAWKVFCSVFVTVTILSLAIYFVIDWLLPN